MLKFSACYEFDPGLYEFETNTPRLIDLARDKGPGHIILQNKYKNINCIVQKTTFFSFILVQWLKLPRKSKLVGSSSALVFMVRFLVRVTIYRSLRMGRDVHLDPSEAYDIS